MTETQFLPLFSSPSLARSRFVLVPVPQSRLTKHPAAKHLQLSFQEPARVEGGQKSNWERGGGGFQSQGNNGVEQPPGRVR